MESEERDRHAVQARLHEASARMKTLESFDFNQPRTSRSQDPRAGEGGYIERAEPVVLMGEMRHGQTHWPTGCACRLPPETAVRFHHAANLVNELVEAQQQGRVRRCLGTMVRPNDLIALERWAMFRWPRSG